MGINVDVFGLWGLLIIVVVVVMVVLLLVVGMAESGRRGAHQSRRRLHLGLPRRRAVGDVRRDEGLQGLLSVRPAVLWEGVGSTRPGQKLVVVVVVLRLLMGKVKERHSRGLLMFRERERCGGKEQYQNLLLF